MPGEIAEIRTHDLLDTSSKAQSKLFSCIPGCKTSKIVQFEVINGNEIDGFRFTA